MKNTIKKVLAELQKDKPDLSYIRGMLEVLVDGDASEKLASLPVIGGIQSNIPAPAPYTITNTHSDEKEIIPDALRPGPLGRIA